jgi:hypothetical protein
MRLSNIDKNKAGGPLLSIFIGGITLWLWALHPSE